MFSFTIQYYIVWDAKYVVLNGVEVAVCLNLPQYSIAVYKQE